MRSLRQHQNEQAETLSVQSNATPPPPYESTSSLGDDPDPTPPDPPPVPDNTKTIYIQKVELLLNGSPLDQVCKQNFLKINKSL